MTQKQGYVQSQLYFTKKVSFTNLQFLRVNHAVNHAQISDVKNGKFQKKTKLDVTKGFKTQVKCFPRKLTKTRTSILLQYQIFLQLKSTVNEFVLGFTH